MITTRKRGDSFHVDGTMGSFRVRGALGTKDKLVASRLRSRIELAMVEGARSENWVDLKRTLPASTFGRLAKAAGVKVEETPTWDSLVSIFWTHCENRMRIGKMSKGTYKRYTYAVEAFTQYLEGNTDLADITPFVIEDYKAVRFAEICSKANAGSGNGLAVDISVLHTVFELAVDRGMVRRNPVEKSHTKADSERLPFTGSELKALREASTTDEERLVYAVLRYTGLRVSDAVDLQWQHVQKMEISKRTLKRGVIVHIPMAEALRETLDGIRNSTGHVILVKNNPATTAQVRSIVRLIGERAEVSSVHPHRFRHSFAVDMLMKGASTFEVAKALGDSVATVEKHYLRFVPEMRARVKGLLDDQTKGLEAL